ncbi:hypothetical protein GE061_004854 [Apolygus lucorum]|uniref:Uncharacterized protein n=1 Tax=Apolygus lucorum TaxID=248454 RepID=A0A6A4J6R3_APOLU|nr:hypothetical protein GE061_004854 [Apolygus lucorum]
MSVADDALIHFIKSTSSYIKRTKMKRECCVPMCSKVYSHTFKKTQDKTTYFSFPTNEIYQRVWAKLVSRREKNGDLWMPSSSSRICSLHFEESQFRHWANYRRLLPNALPTVFPGYPDKILRRQWKIIENFRKNHPLGEETLDKSSSGSRRKGNESINGEDSVQDEVDDSHQSESEISKLKRHTEEGGQDEDYAEDSEVPKHSEESKPFKKRRIDSELQVNGNVLEGEFNTGGQRSKTTKSSFSEINSHSSQILAACEPIVKIQRLEKEQLDSMLGRGKRKKMRSVKLEYDSDASKVANDSPTDEDYIPQEEFSRKPPEKSNTSRPKNPEWNQRLEEERYDSEESQVSKKPPERGTSSKAKSVQVIRKQEEETSDFDDSMIMKKMKVMQQQIKWKDERLFTLNQKAVSERNARLKAEKELGFLKDYMKSLSLEVPNPSESDLKSVDLDSNRSTETPNKSASSSELELMSTIKRLKEVIATKDKCLVELSKNKKPISVRNDYGALQGDWHPKNRFVQTVKKILEDSLDGDDQALFLLDQLESYGNDDVENFRMTTIKKCVEWKLMNARGYESVRQMGILALPSSKLLRDHVDILTETGVTAREEVGVESDLGELEDEIEEEEDDNKNVNKLPSSPKKIQIKKTSFLSSLQSPEEDEMLKVIGKTRQKFMKELQLSSSSIKVDVGNIRKSPQTKTIEQKKKSDALKCDSAKVGNQSGVSKQPFRMELSSGILIEEIKPADENSPVKSEKASVDKRATDVSKESKDDGKNVSSNSKDAGQNKEDGSKNSKVEVLIDEDPTSENLDQDVNCADIDNDPELASEDMPKRASKGGHSATEYTEEAATEVMVEPASDVIEPVSEDLMEDLVETVTEEMAEQDSEGRLNSSDLKDEIHEERLPAGCYIEEVRSSDDD